MITLLNSLDDSSCRTLNFHPCDVLDYGKEQGRHKEIAERFPAVRGKQEQGSPANEANEANEALDISP